MNRALKMAFETKATIHTMGGKLLKLSHESASTKTPMALNLFLPPLAIATSSPATNKVPVLFYLSGLTCTGDNCAEKGFVHAAAAKHNIAVVYPDTSPRGTKIAGEDEAYDFGSGAGFYVDATEQPWAENYNMYSYVAKELPEKLWEGFPVLDQARVGITGHSMGGHGALTLFLKNPGLYRSVSAFAPISNPSACPWGEKAFGGYLGGDRSRWAAHDATELVKGWAGKDVDILIDVGTGDNFYKQGQLLPENFAQAAKEAGVGGKGVTLRLQEGYDHSYYFISTFAADHVDHHAKYLCK